MEFDLMIKNGRIVDGPGMPVFKGNVAVNFLVPILSVGMMALNASMVFGQTYPNKPVRVFAGAPGGATDFIARIVATGISGPLGQPVIVENRPSNVVAGIVAKAPPDGYSLLITGSELWRSPLIQTMPYDFETDFSPITTLLSLFSIMTVHPSLPVKSVKELLALAKARPGELNYASGPTGSPTHLTMELLKAMGGVNIVRITYNSSAQGLIDQISGQVQTSIIAPNDVMVHVKAGRLRALAITSAQPSALLPSLPTMAASGLPGYEFVSIIGLWATAKTPDAIIARLNREVVRILNQSDVKQQYLNRGAEPPIVSSPEEFAAAVKADRTKMGKLIKDLGIRAEQ